MKSSEAVAVALTIEANEDSYRCWLLGCVMSLTLSKMI
jgi:hypothetical protein